MLRDSELILSYSCVDTTMDILIEFQYLNI